MFDIFALGRLCTAAYDKQQNLALLLEINSVSWLVMKPKFTERFTNWLGITQVAKSHRTSPPNYLGSSSEVLEFCQPSVKFACPLDIVPIADSIHVDT